MNLHPTILPPSSNDSTKLEPGIVPAKRRKLTGDERLNRSRERNRVHARKTRERKKNQTAALQGRINELYEEGERLRQMIDERYTASGLLGLRETITDKSGDKVPILPSTQVCDNYYHQVLSENSWLREGHSLVGLPFVNLPLPVHPEKRVRRSGKYTPQERERIRRERNRMHAKKTRDRKKFFLETSEKIINEMEKEAHQLREYLLKLGVITEEECKKLQQREIEAKKELASLKVYHHHGQEEEDLEADDQTSSDDEMNVDGERSSSDENEKVSSWSGSNDGSSSSNPSSSNNDSSTSHDMTVSSKSISRDGEETTSNKSNDANDAASSSSQSTSVGHNNTATSSNSDSNNNSMSNSSSGRRYPSMSIGTSEKSDNLMLSGSDDRDSPNEITSSNGNSGSMGSGEEEGDTSSITKQVATHNHSGSDKCANVPVGTVLAVYGHLSQQTGRKKGHVSFPTSSAGKMEILPSREGPSSQFNDLKVSIEPTMSNLPESSHEDAAVLTSIEVATKMGSSNPSSDGKDIPQTSSE